MAAPGADVAGGRDPGWFPDRMNPNVQKYWDGNGWTAQRRWVAGQWQPEPLPGAPLAVQGVPSAAGPVAAPGSAAPPLDSGYYAYGGRPHQSRFVPPPTTAPSATRATSTTRATNPVTSVSGSQAGLLLCSILLIVGSFTPWITVTFGAVSASAAGTDSAISSTIGVNGWITFAGGILLFILVCMAVMSAEPLFRTMALIIAVVVAGFAIYDLVRILQKISESAQPTFNNVPITQLQANGSVGWGLIVAVIGAVGALACAIGQAGSR